MRLKDATSRTSHSYRKTLLFIFAAAVACGVVFVGGALCQREGYLKSWLNISRSFFTSAPEIPVLTFRMNKNNLAKLQKLRSQALDTGVLLTSPKDFVPAMMGLGDETVVPVQMRLKGDWARGHLTGDKWSFRIKVRKGGHFMGMRVFSLHRPAARRNDREWLFHQLLRREGVLALRYLFVRVRFNGEDRGVYALEEHFSKELLESQQRRESVIIKVDETSLWTRLVQMGERRLTRDLRPGGMDYYPFKAFRAKTISRSGTLSAHRDASLQLLRAFADGVLPPSKVFKVSKLAKFLAVAELCDAGHGLAWHNLRFYYDPIESRLEPIGFDAGGFGGRKARLLAVAHVWARRALADPVVASAYVAELQRLSRPDYLAGLREALHAQWQETVRTIRSEWPYMSSRVWTDLAERQGYLRRVLELRPIALATATSHEGPSQKGSGERIAVTVRNATSLPIELLGVRLPSGELLPIGSESKVPVLLHPARSSHGEESRLTFAITLPEDTKGQISVACRIIGTQEQRLVSIQRFAFRLPVGGPRPQAPPMPQLLTLHPFLDRTDDPKVLRIRKGEWTVNGDLVIPEGVSLSCGPGRTLRFAAGKVLICDGGRLNLRGKAKSPVRLLPIRDSWGGVLVVNAPESQWQHVEVERTEGINRKGWTVMGGVAFYKSPVRFEHCRFIDSRSEDAVNVVRGHAVLQECQFVGTKADAFDGDFITGLIEGCTFAKVGGDGIDISGSDLMIKRTVLRDVSDKALSIGEDSRAVLSEVLVERARIGVASKDLSRVEASQLVFREVGIAVAAYIKKPEYGPASAILTSLTLENVKQQALVQTGSSVLIDGERFPGRDIDVRALYPDARDN